MYISSQRIRPMYVVATLYILSAVVRAGEGMGVALASVSENKDNTTNITCQMSPEQISAGLDRRENQIKASEIVFENKKRALDALNSEIDEKMKLLAAQEENIKSLHTLTEKSSEQDIKQLISIYEAMKPKEAAMLFMEMDPSFAAGFLGKMKPAEAALVMSNMNAKSAYNISAIIAARNSKSMKTN